MRHCCVPSDYHDKFPEWDRAVIDCARHTIRTHNIHKPIFFLRWGTCGTLFRDVFTFRVRPLLSPKDSYPHQAQFLFKSRENVINVPLVVYARRCQIVSFFCARCKEVSMRKIELFFLIQSICVFLSIVKFSSTLFNIPWVFLNPYFSSFRNGVSF